MTNLTLLFVLILSIGCNLRFNKSKKNNDNQQIDSNEILLENEQLFDIMPNLQGYYSVNIKKYKNAKAVKRVSSTGSEKFISFENKNSFNDKNLPEGSSFKYIYGYYQENNFVKVHSINVDIPKDLIIENKIYTTISELKNSDGKYNRLFLSNSTVLTNGKKTLINFKEIYVNNSSIKTFKLNQKAEENKNGRNGGEIEIITDKIEGDLIVYLRGEHAGESVNSSVWNNNTINSENCLVNSNNNIAKVLCLEQVSPVLLHGYNGGSTGKFVLNANNSEKLKLTVKKDVGLGSSGRPLYTATTEIPIENVSKVSALKIVAESSNNLLGRFLDLGWCKGITTFPYANIYYCATDVGFDGLNGREEEICIKSNNKQMMECR